MMKYNTVKIFVVQDCRLLEAHIQKLGCPESNFVSTTSKRTTPSIWFPFGPKLLKVLG
jgi:hypothetical protein